MSPRIAVTSGEPAGIGPELCLALARHPCAAHPVVLADRALLEERAALLGLNVSCREYHPANQPADGVLDVLHVPLASPAKPGELDAANGPYVLAVLDRAGLEALNAAIARGVAARQA